MSLTLTLYSDPHCPWCWIGKRRIEAALERLGLSAEAAWTLKAYELMRRDQPVQPVLEHLAQKYRQDREGVGQMFERVRVYGAPDGLSFDFGRAQAAPSFDAHRLLKWAASFGSDRELLERMHQAHFNEGRVLSDHATLVNLAADTGLDAAGAAKMLAGGGYAAEVEQELREGRELGVRGVPFLVLNDEFAVSGAQPVEVFVRAINQAVGAA